MHYVLLTQEVSGGIVFGLDLLYILVVTLFSFKENFQLK